ncbi:MAG: hemolysin family protein [Treponema sp.]|nr:hemolysin family protein [Treponema sp.]
MKERVHGKLFFKRDPEINRKALESLEKDEKEMIQGILELSLTMVKEVMVPRIDTVFISADSSREELFKVITSGSHSRFPVYEETIDNVIGILHIKDLLNDLVSNDHEDGKIDIRKLARAPFFVPETKRIDELLREFRRRKVHIAVVVDEYGGVSGIVFMENIIEEIIGDIQDEFDNEKEDIQDLGSGTWLCDARVNLEDLAGFTGISLPMEDFDTLGGFVFDLFGKIPVKYEKVEWEGHDFIIQDVEGHKINTVKIVRGKSEKD